MCIVLLFGGEGALSVLCPWKKDAVERSDERPWRGTGGNGESQNEDKKEGVEIKSLISSGEEEM